ncbi:hypothetical protein B0A55_01933 [Friedmanniomyces simplex]|uniref:RING-type domain-containing protein n=1 Tax=Friedmanniomyces simplex TaxID=329884 RepID=A0A4U0Y315_9PEZI|nr:hypothetical protein B0A55_01933 [Friedmanniomyces simplex]
MDTINDISGLTHVQQWALMGVKAGDFIQLSKVSAPPSSTHGAFRYGPRPAEDSGNGSDDEAEEEDGDRDEVMVTSVQGSEGEPESEGEGAHVAVGDDVVVTSVESSVYDAQSDIEESSDAESNDGIQYGVLVTSERSSVGDLESEGEKSDQEEEDVGHVDDELMASVQGGIGDPESNNKESASMAHSTEPTTEESDGEDSHMIPDTTLFFVQGVTRVKDTIVGIALIEMDYARRPDQDIAPHSYQILGDSISHTDTHADDCTCTQLKSFKQLNEVYDMSGYCIRLNPSGDDVRIAVAAEQGGYAQCPVCGDEGFLDTLAELAAVLDTTIYTTPAITDHAILCPVCMGLDLLTEQQALRATLELTSLVDLEDVIDWCGRLSPRRQSLGYEFYQLDEREWGYYFDDMQDGHEGNGDNGFEQLPAELMDPNSGVRLQPADKKAVAALPRKTFAGVEDPKRAGESCLICREDFEGGERVVELPCGHVFHEVGCIEQWLGVSSHQCPTCRAKLPMTEEGKKVADTAEASAGEGGEDVEMATPTAGVDVGAGVVGGGALGWV